MNQQSNKLKRVLTAPFAWFGQHPIIAILIVLVLVCSSLLAFIVQVTNIDQATTPTPVSKSTSTHLASVSTPIFTPGLNIKASSLHWITSQTFTGNGAKKTSSFSVPTIWRIVWSCDPASHNNTSYNLFIHANTVNNVLLANSVETTCNKNNTHSTSMMHQAGKVYLSIISEGKWQVQVQYTM